jgi:AcrR family transcriptional regulator
MSGTRAQQKEQTRVLLLRTAYQVFSERGIVGSRVSDVARAAGVAQGTVFTHFASQEALIEAVVAHYGERIALRTHELASTGGGLAGILRAHLDGIAEYEPFYARLVIENRLLPRSVRDTLIGLQAAISFHLSQVIATEPDTGIPPHLLFNLWIGLVHHYLANGDLFAPQGHVIERYGATLIDTYLRLLDPEKRTTTRKEHP